MNSIMLKRLSTILIGSFIYIAILIPSCSNTEHNDPAYLQEVEDWHARRIASLKKPDSWLSLAGLFWLKEGKNSFGASEGNQIKFPPGKSLAKMGWFTLQDGSVSIHIKDDVPVYFNGHKISSMKLRDDGGGEGDPDILQYRSLSWHIIKRGNRYGVRLKDSESELLGNFASIERFPVDPKWKVIAFFQAYDTPKVIEVPNILGTISEDPSPGKLTFVVKGQSYSLDPIADPDDKRWFIIFSDATSGEETYGAGRFLYIDAPAKDNSAIIDFNKAYNPPCAFTPYATCSLPPEQNHLPLRVTAGEKNFQGYEH